MTPALDSVRTAMMEVDRREVIPVAPLQKDIERELIAMEVCVRELAVLTPEQRNRVMKWVDSVLEARQTQPLRQPQAVRAS